MLFSSIAFIFYFLPIVLILYYPFKRITPIKNFILLAASLFFYAWGEPEFVAVMVISIIVNYILALLVNKNRKKSSIKFLLFLSVIFNIGLLFTYKHLDFILGTLGHELRREIPLTNLILPMGISFFTLQELSYVIDVYRQRAEVQKNIFDMALYVCFFPKMLAGPIVRYSEVADQLAHRKETWDKFSVGVCRFIAGLSKKIILADNLAIVANQIFESSHLGTIPVTLAWLGSLAFTLQIFFDFSGYSDMAIGLGLMFGFKFEENFNYPYISRSVSEFWRRWHISLSNWFKEYVYFPLGGSHISNMDKVIRNMLVVWLLTGIWHGAEWTYIVWGLLNFALLVVERFIDLENIKGHGVIKWLYTMFAINFGWVLFRSGNLIYAGNYIKSMFGFGGSGFFSDYALMYIREYGFFFIVGMIFCIPVGKRYNYMVVSNKVHTLVFDLLYPLVMIGLFVICIACIMHEGSSPFMYFAF